MNSPPVISNFESSCATYDANAHIQTIAANWLLDLLAELQERIPPGDALELGCGTGVFSSSLLSVCRGRRITFSDASERLLETCRTRIGMAQRSTDTSFERLDINALPEQHGRLALIASSFVLQWADNFEVCLETLSNWLVPGGYLFFSVPTNESFSEWQRICTLYNLKYTANHLPNEEQIIRAARRSGLSSRILTNSHTIRYKDAR